MNYIQGSLIPLAEYLLARYPGVRIVSALREPRPDGILQQTIRYQAPLEKLKMHGLVTQGMIDRAPKHSITPLGDGFTLCEGLDSESTPGQWDLQIYTGSVPREWERFSVREAQRVLKTLARRDTKAKLVNRVLGGIK